MAFKKGQKVRLLVHGAGVTSEETGIVESVTKKGIKLEGLDTLYSAAGKTGVLDFGFSFEIKPLETKKGKK